MQRLLCLLIVAIALGLPAFAQGFIGGGLTSAVTGERHRQGPFLEILAPVGESKIGQVTASTIFLPEPGARFAVALHPKYFENWRYKPYVAIGGEWENRLGRDEWHSVLTLGVSLPDGLTLRASRLHLSPQGYRLGADWQYRIKEGVAVRVSADATIHRHAADRGRLTVGLFKTF